MAQTRNLFMYSDIKQVLDTVIEAGGGRFIPTDRSGQPSKSAAIRWRFRAYFFRKLALDLERQRVGDVPGHQPRTPYDTWTFDLDGDAVVIRPLAVKGNLFGLDGKPLTVGPPLDQPDLGDEELLREMEKLNLEIPE